MNKERCRYCRKREAVLDGLCRFCWETLTELWGAAPLKAQAMPAQAAKKNLMVKHDKWAGLPWACSPPRKRPGQHERGAPKINYGANKKARLLKLSSFRSPSFTAIADLRRRSAENISRTRINGHSQPFWRMICRPLHSDAIGLSSTLHFRFGTLLN
jgi:hypothetical protein